jgi:small subunit ribosomal protein S20
MAHTKSALKRARQNVRRRADNRSGRSVIKTMAERLDKVVAGKDAAAIAKELSNLHSALDKAAKHGVITRNTAVRRKARANARVAKAKVAA